MFLLISILFSAITFRYPAMCAEPGPAFGMAYLARLAIALAASAMVEPFLIWAALRLRSIIGSLKALLTYCWMGFALFSLTIVPIGFYLSGSCPSVRQARLSPYSAEYYFVTSAITLGVVGVIGYAIRRRGVIQARRG
jgi:hypothetical protein